MKSFQTAFSEDNCSDYAQKTNNKIYILPLQTELYR